MDNTDLPTYGKSILDTDLYKFTMQQAVMRHFPDATVAYRFKNRSRDKLFDRKTFETAREGINQLGSLALLPEEMEWLKSTCPYLQPDYLEYLSNFRFRPEEQISINFVPRDDTPGLGDITIDVVGKWIETILYEVPVMSILSEVYFRHQDTDWALDGQVEKAYLKGQELFRAGILLSEFGTRRRRSGRTQDLVIQGLVRAHKERSVGESGKLVGTSNVHFARIHGLTPTGTIAHEWTMGIAALKGYEGAHKLALELWEDIYPPEPSNALHIALADTFTSMAFFKDLANNPSIATRWRGVRQDSGNPFEFILLARQAYESMGIDPQAKTIVFSDSLDVDLSIRIKAECDKAGFTGTFGIGTFLTNDFTKLSNSERSKPLNIVIKLRDINGIPCVKISDDLTKNTGEEEAVRAVKEIFGLPQS